MRRISQKKKSKEMNNNACEDAFIALSGGNISGVSGVNTLEPLSDKYVIGQVSELAIESFVNTKTDCQVNVPGGKVIFLKGVNLVPSGTIFGKPKTTQLNVSPKGRNIIPSYEIPKGVEEHTVIGAVCCPLEDNKYLSGWIISTESGVKYLVYGLCPIMVGDPIHQMPLWKLKCLGEPIKYTSGPPKLNPYPEVGFPLYQLKKNGHQCRVETQSDKILYLLELYGEIPGSKFKNIFKEFFGIDIDLQGKKLGEFLIKDNGVSLKNDDNNLPIFFIEKGVKVTKTNLSETKIGGGCPRENPEDPEDLGKIREMYELEILVIHDFYKKQIKSLLDNLENEEFLSSNEEFFSEEVPVNVNVKLNFQWMIEYHKCVDKIIVSSNELTIHLTNLTSKPDEHNLSLYSTALTASNALISRRDELWELIHPLKTSL